MRYSAVAIMGLVLLGVKSVTYLHVVNNLMIMEIADHLQINLAMVFQLMKLVETC